MFFLATILGLVAGLACWYLLSYVVAHSITWAETRNPQLAGSTRVRVGEIAGCSVAFAAAFLVAFWIIRLMTESMK